MKIKRRTVVLVAVVAFISCNRNSQHTETSPASIQAENAAPSPTPTPDWGYGKAVFQMKSCNTCHVMGKEEKSTGMNLEELRAKMSEDYSLAKFTKVVHRQGTLMPSYKGFLSKREICCLYGFLTNAKQVEGCVKCKTIAVID